MYELRSAVGGLHCNDFANYCTLTYKVASIPQPSNCLCASDFMNGRHFVTLKIFVHLHVAYKCVEESLATNWSMTTMAQDTYSSFAGSGFST